MTRVATINRTNQAPTSTKQPTLDAQTSRKVLAMARDQQDEVALEDDEEDDGNS